ncbi:agamous-like MADS-box protein AGL62 [Quercus lobata]|uniref:MADS-box domain-containing protein n=1 Tax=Quercus lobata TaxID=97700 RepID=A0A7N2LRD4_QUELO|nr:agamous-like MADS-box protein AGL62 [Quercus lobata]
MMVRPKGMGRSKIEIKEIQNKGAMYCTFTKRRNGLCSKARELHTLCGAQVAAIVFSPMNKMYTFGEPSVDSVVNRFLYEQHQQPLNRGGQKKKKTILFLSDECIEGFELHELKHCTALMEKFVKNLEERLANVVYRRVQTKDLISLIK